MRQFILVFLFIFIFVSPSHSRVFKCKTLSGKTTYQATKCLNITKQKEIDIEKFEPVEIIEEKKITLTEITKRRRLAAQKRALESSIRKVKAKNAQRAEIKRRNDAQYAYTKALKKSKRRMSRNPLKPYLSKRQLWSRSSNP